MKNKIAVLIDDEPVFLQKFKMIFKKLRLKFGLVTFNTSDSMISEYTSGKYGVTLIDLNLKGSTMDGLQLAEQVSKINDTKIYIISTSDGNRPWEVDKTKTELERAKELGVEGWIVKGGVKLVRRLEKLFKDIDNGKFGYFKIYDQ